MTKLDPHVELKLSEYFRTISADYFQYWVYPETSRFLFFTEHYFTRNKDVGDTINFSTDDILRELQVELRMPTSLPLKIVCSLARTFNMRIECPKCKTLQTDLLKHVTEDHKEGITVGKIDEPSKMQEVQ